jgi:hypothetical protein
VVLARLAIVERVGTEPATVVGALVDGFDIVVLAGNLRFEPRVCAQIAAKARQRGCVLVPYGIPWHGVEVTLKITSGQWTGVGEGVGRPMYVTSSGRGAAVQQREAAFWCPPPRDIVGRPIDMPPPEPLKRPGLRAVS